jgi:hypothetical protein
VLDGDVTAVDRARDDATRARASVQINSIRRGPIEIVARRSRCNFLRFACTYRRCWWWNPRCWRSHRTRRGRASRRARHRRPEIGRGIEGRAVSGGVRTSSDRAMGDFACRSRDAEGFFPVTTSSVVARTRARDARRRRGRRARSPRDAFSSCRPARVARWIVARALTVKVERAARREVSSAEAKVTTDARLGAAGATARARRDSVLPTKAGRATTAEAAEVMAAIVSTRCVRI